MDRFSLDEIHSIRKAGTIDNDENKILFTDVVNDLSLKFGIKSHDYLYLYCDMCPGLRSNTVGKVFKEESKNRTCKSCFNIITNKNLENNGKLPDNFVIEKSYKVKNGWKQTKKNKEELSVENEKLKETVELLKETVEKLTKSIETSSDDLFITQNNIPELELINGYKLEYRNSDGYINVTDLCKAAGKEYYKWKQFSKTTPFLEALSQRTLRGSSELIYRATGGNYTTWVHPYVAINIAQWASPDFAAQVCIWVFEIIVTGKVDSSNPTDYNILQEKFQKSLQELEVIKSDYSLLQANNIELEANNIELEANNIELEANNIELEKEVKVLEKKCKKKIKRTQYGEGYMVYILQEKYHKEAGIYKIGKSKKITDRV